MKGAAYQDVVRDRTKTLEWMSALFSGIRANNHDQVHEV